jgi:hypothetical protein
MAQQSYPFENVDVTETQFSKWARHIGEGVNGGPDTTSLLATGDDSGLQVRIAAGEAMVRGHYYINTSQATLTLDTAGTDTRIDAIVVELDAAANSIVLKIVQGIAVASSPVPPTPTQTDIGIYQILIGLVTIPSSATSIVSADVTDRRTFIIASQQALHPFLMIGA